VYNITLGDKFITFFIAKVNLEENKITYVNAGHNPPIFYHGGTVDRFDIGTTVLGAVSELPEIEMGMVDIEQDTMIVNFTDGLTDLLNDKGEYFTLDLLTEMLCECRELKCKEFMEKLRNSLEK